MNNGDDAFRTNKNYLSKQFVSNLLLMSYTWRGTFGGGIIPGSDVGRLVGGAA